MTHRCAACGTAPGTGTAPRRTPGQATWRLRQVPRATGPKGGTPTLPPSRFTRHRRPGCPPPAGAVGGRPASAPIPHRAVDPGQVPPGHRAPLRRPRRTPLPGNGGMGGGGHCIHPGWRLGSVPGTSPPACTLAPAARLGAAAARSDGALSPGPVACPITGPGTGWRLPPPGSPAHRTCGLRGRVAA